MRSGKQQKTEGIELQNQQKFIMLGEKENYKYLEILKVNTIKQAEMIEKILKRVSQENKKTTRNQTM